MASNPRYRRNRSYTGTFTMNCPECDAPIQVDFDSGYPAPVCSNHDSPAFSDPGDPSSAEVTSGVTDDGKCIQCGTVIDQTRLYEQCAEKAQDADEAAYEAEQDRKYEDYRDRCLDDYDARGRYVGHK